jgi:DUF2075 family protein
MTDYKIQRLPFQPEAVSSWGQIESQGENWPVVYTISAEGEIYIGETLNAVTRLSQHLNSPNKQHLERVHIILNDKFNKSVCLDLESHLIRYFAADGKHRVLNANSGITDANYFNRDEYRQSFQELFDILVKDGVLSRSIPEIVNSNLFKFSPFKALNTEQSVSLSAVLERLLSDIKTDTQKQIIIQGDPGTGKTVVAVYLIKLLTDIARVPTEELLDQDSIFSDFFTDEARALIKDFRIGLVVPQQSLRKTIQTVFAQTPGLSKDMVLTPFDVGESTYDFDLLIVDEAHRLGQRANQSSAAQNLKFAEINRTLFGNDNFTHTQLDWIKQKSRHQLLLLDTAQSVKPSDLPLETTQSLLDQATSSDSVFKLTSQMRVAGGNDYLEFVKALFSDTPNRAGNFKNYDLRFFDEFAPMREAILAIEEQHGLSRLVAGFAWPWVTKNDKSAFDIEIEGVKMVWNQTPTDWVNSKNSVNEVGSIHTVQGYDLNYAGVIIGNDIGLAPETGELVFNRENYFDAKGKENNPRLGITYSDEDLLHFVLNIYKVLMTRGIRGTFVYVCDPELRAKLKQVF